MRHWILLDAIVLAIPGKAGPLPTSKANSRVPQGVEMQVTEKVQSCAKSTKRVTLSIPSAHVPRLGSDIPSDSMLSLVCPSLGRASGRVKYLYIFCLTNRESCRSQPSAMVITKMTSLMRLQLH